MKAFLKLSWLNKIPVSTWITLVIVGTAALMLWWDAQAENQPTTPPRPAIAGREAKAEPVAFMEEEEIAPDENDARDPSDFKDPLPPGAVARLGTIRLHHEKGASCCCFLPDSRTLATAGGEGTIRFWEASTGKEQRVLRGHTGGITSLAFTPDGKIMASVGWWRPQARLWDVISGKQMRVLTGPGGEAFACAFAPDGKTFITGHRDGALHRWETATGKELPGFLGHEGIITHLRYTPDGKMLVSCANDRTVRFWNVATSQPYWVIYLPEDVSLVAISPDGKMMAQNTAATTRLVDVAFGAVLQVLRQGGAYRMIFSPDGRRLAIASRDQPMRLWDIATGKTLLEIQSKGRYGALTCCFSPSNKLLATTEYTAIRIWDAQTGKELVKVPRLQAITALRFSPDGRTLTTGSIDRTVRLWEVATARQLHFARANARVIDLSPDGKVAATIPEPHSRHPSVLASTVCLCDTATGKQLHVLKSEQAVRGVAFTPDSKLVAVPEWSHPGKICLWETTTGKSICCFGNLSIGKGITFGFTTLPAAFFPDGKMLACGCADCTVHIVDVTTGQQCRQIGQPLGLDDNPFLHPELNGITCLAISADGKLLAAAVDYVHDSQSHAIHLWEMASGKELGRLRIPQKPPTSVNALAFSPDGKTLASVHREDNTVHLWDVATGKERQRLYGHRAEVFSVAFSSDGKLLASGSLDGTALIWNLQVERLLFQR